MMSEEDAATQSGLATAPLKFGTIPKTTDQVNAEAIRAAAPTSGNNLVSKVRESISAGAGGLGLVSAVEAMFVPREGAPFSNPRFGMFVNDGDVLKVVIRGNLVAETSASNGKASVNVHIAPNELYVNGKPADRASFALAERGYDTYVSTRNLYKAALRGVDDYKTFKGEVRATVSSSSGTIKVVIDGITAS